MIKTMTVAFCIVTSLLMCSCATNWKCSSCGSKYRKCSSSGCGLREDKNHSMFNHIPLYNSCSECGVKFIKERDKK